MDALEYSDAVAYYGLQSIAPTYYEFDTNMEAFFFIIGAYRAIGAMSKGEMLFPLSGFEYHPSDFCD